MFHQFSPDDWFLILWSLGSIGAGFYSMRRGLKAYRSPVSLEQVGFGLSVRLSQWLFGARARQDTEEYLQNHQRVVRLLAIVSILGGIVLIGLGLAVLYISLSPSRDI